MKSAFASGTASADVVSGVTDKAIRVTSLVISAVSGCTVQLQSGGTTDLTPAFPIVASGNLTLSNELGLFETAAGEKLNAVVSSGGDYSVMVTYREV